MEQSHSIGSSAMCRVQAMEPFERIPISGRNGIPGHAFSLQSIQLRIATRGIQLLAPGGLMVYSTCSMNPIENESVVAQLLQAFPGQIKLLEINDKLPGLKTKPGLTQWSIMAKNQEVYNNFEEVPKTLQSLIRPNMFSPSSDVLQELHLERW